jgi:hypothetical protein
MVVERGMDRGEHLWRFQACAPIEQRVSTPPTVAIQQVWALHSLAGKRVPGRIGSVATLRFAPGETVSGTIMCNFISTTKLRWTQDGGSTRGGFDQLGNDAGIVTTVGCLRRPGSAMADRFWRNVETARAWSMTGKRLVIEFGDGSEARLVALESSRHRELFQRLGSSVPFLKADTYSKSYVCNVQETHLLSNTIRMLPRELSMPPCIFCKSTLAHNAKPEHILLDALGGRKTSRRIVCTACNEKFGSGIDKELAESVGFIRNNMGFQSGSGNPAPSYSYNSKNGMVKAKSDGRLSPSIKPFAMDKDGKVKSVTFDPRYPRAKENAISNAAAAQGIDPDELRRKLDSGSVTYTDSFAFGPKDNIESSIGGRQAQRSIAEACMELLAVKVGAESLLDSAFDGVRAFVLNDAEHGSWAVELDSRPLSTEVKLIERYGPFFNHIQVSVSADGNVVGHFTLYNFVGWKVELARNSPLGECRIQLISNPLDPTIWSYDDPALPPLEVSWLKEPSFDETVFNERQSKLFLFSKNASIEREIRRIVDEEAHHHGISDETVIEDQGTLNSFVVRISDRSAHLITKSSYHYTRPSLETKK